MDGQVIFTAIILGGFGQVIAGLQDYKRKNLFGSTATTDFGAVLDRLRAGELDELPQAG